MGRERQTTVDSVTEPKKRRRVAFFNIDTGVHAKECIKIYLVCRKEEVGSTDGFCIEPVDLNNFFEEDGMIYGYQGLKITIWFSIVSFHAYADITFQSTSDGGKGITDLKSALQNIFAETLMDNKDDFLQTFSKDVSFIGSIITNGELLHPKASDGQSDNSNIHLQAANSDFEVVRLLMGNMTAGHLYSRLIPLALLLIDGSSPIDVSDPRWELYLLIQKKNDQLGYTHPTLLGFAALYRFYHYPDGSRLRLSQILVLPPYQHKGFGRCLLEVLNNVAVSENVYDLTIEEPLNQLQHLRTCIDVKRLRGFETIQEAVNSAVSQFTLGKISKKASSPRLVPPPNATEAVRKSLKITKKQFLHCWEILVFLGLDPVEKHMEDFVTVVSSRMRDEIIGKGSDTEGKQVVDVQSDNDQEMSFVMFRSKGDVTAVEIDESHANQEEQFMQLVDERVREIKLIAQKVSAD